MKNKILKTTICVAALVIGTSVFAGPCYGPPPPNSGVCLAADIVNLVGASLNILRGPTVVYSEPAVYTAPAPVVYTTPAPVVYNSPVYYAPQPYYYRPAPPPPPPRHYGPGPGRGPGCGPGRGPGCGPGRGPGCGPGRGCGPRR